MIEASAMRIFVARCAVLLEPEVRRIAPTVPNVMTVGTAHFAMSALEWPARHTMIEALFASARPAHELGVAAKMLDVTATAVLLLILLTTVETFSAANARPQVIVT